MSFEAGAWRNGCECHWKLEVPVLQEVESIHVTENDQSFMEVQYGFLHGYMLGVAAGCFFARFSENVC